MIKVKLFRTIYFSFIACLALGCSGYLLATHDGQSSMSYSPKAHATKTNIIHTTRAHRYRVYSSHYFSIEKHDLAQLHFFDNRLANESNNVYEQRFNGTHPIYHKFHDHNYWSVYRDQAVPSNYKGSHMSHHIYYAIQHRVLRSHGIFSGVNFHHYKHKPVTEI